MPRSAAAVVDKDTQFALALIEHKFKGAQAAIACGYAANSASVTASRLLSRAKVQEVLASELEAIRSRQQITIHDMYEEWRRIAMSNMEDYSYEDGEGETRVRLPHGNRALMAAVKSIETTEVSKETDGGDAEIITRRTKITLHDKVTGMDKLSRLFGMWEGKEAPVTVINGNVQVNDNRTIENKMVIVNVVDAAEAYKKLMGR